MLTSKCLIIGLIDSKSVMTYFFEGQSHPETLRVNIQQFHRCIRQMAIKVKQDLPQDGIVGPWNSSDIANMDQTAVEFCFN